MQNKQNFIHDQIPAGKKLAGKRILFACVPGDGHFKPLTGLAKHFQARGYDVRWYTSAMYARNLEKLKIPHLPFKKGLEVTGQNIDVIFPERKHIRNKIKKLNFDIVHFFTRRAPEYFEDIREIQKTFPFDLLVADCTFTAIPLVKEIMNIPVISIGVMPLFETSKDLPPSGLGLTPSHSLFGRMKQAFLRYFVNKFMFKQANNVMKEILGAYDIETGKSSLFDVLVKKSSLVLQSGTPGFEYHRSDLGKNIRFIGSLLPHSEAAHTEQWFDKRLNQYKKIVLVTQGTVEKDIEKIIVPTLKAFRNTDVLVVATTGGTQTWELKQQFPDDNFIIEDFIAFEDVMPYADVYVSNGGYGGVMLAIENKLPMVVAGVHEGKNEINARIGYFNLGINLKTELPGVIQMRAAVDEVLQNDVYRSNVIRLGEEFDTYDPKQLIENYVEELLGTTSSNKLFIIPAFNQVA